MLHSLFLFLALFATWIVLSGYFQAFFLIGGALSCAIAVYVAWRMEKVEGEKQQLMQFKWQLVTYGFWLIKEIMVSSVKTAHIMWQVKPNISPTVTRIPVLQKNDFGRALFANSITLTPGTVAVIVEPGQVLIHALQEGNADDLLAGEMNRRVREVTG